MNPERLKHGLTDYSDAAVTAEGDVVPGDDVFPSSDELTPDYEADVDNPQIERDALAAIQELAININKELSSDNPPTRWTLNQQIGRHVAAIVKMRERRGLSTRGIIPIPGRDRAPGALGFSPKVHDKTSAHLPETELDKLTANIVDKRNLDYATARQIAAEQLGIRP